MEDQRVGYRGITGSQESRNQEWGIGLYRIHEYRVWGLLGRGRGRKGLELAGDPREGTHHELLVLGFHLPQGWAAPGWRGVCGLVGGHAASQNWRSPANLAESEARRSSQISPALLCSPGSLW